MQYATILFTYFATILRLQRAQFQHGKQIETIKKKDKNNITTTARAFLFDLNNVYLLFRMAIILVFILCGISSQLTIVIAPTSTIKYTNRSVYDDCNGDGCGLIGIFLVDEFLSNYSSESGIANDGKSIPSIIIEKEERERE